MAEFTIAVLAGIGAGAVGAAIMAALLLRRPAGPEFKWWEQPAPADIGDDPPTIPPDAAWTDDGDLAWWGDLPEPEPDPDPESSNVLRDRILERARTRDPEDLPIPDPWND